MNEIKNNLKVFKSQKTKLLARLNAIKRSSEQLRQKAKSTELDGWESICENADSYIEDITKYIASLEIEIAKVECGLKALETMKCKEGRFAMIEYMTEDTTISEGRLRNANNIYKYAASLIADMNIIAGKSGALE